MLQLVVAPVSYTHLYNIFSDVKLISGNSKMIVTVALCSQLLMLQLVVAKDCSGSTTKPLNLVLLLILQLVVANDCCRSTMFLVVNVTPGSSK